jgi:KipI family sensor histidine kinase inhibitor
MTGGYRILPNGDSTLVIEFEERIDASVNAKAVAAADSLRQAGLAGVRDVVSTYRTVAVYFDPLRTNLDALVRTLDESARSDPPATPAVEPIRIPVCYGGEFGPDLAEVAAYAKLTESETATIHWRSTYRVFMLGFLPGFAYLGSVDARIAAPRRATPRVRVPAGSVGIAGAQTGIYPSDSPGGWQLIGRTPVRPFDLRHPEPCLLAAGDTVQFYPIDASQFDAPVASGRP